MVDHADGGYHRVEREDGIQHHNLRHHRPEAGAFARTMLLFIFTLQPLVKLHGSFEQQEDTPDQHNKVASAKRMTGGKKQRLGERGQPRDGSQQGQAHQQCQ